MYFFKIESNVNTTLYGFANTANVEYFKDLANFDNTVLNY